MTPLAPNRDMHYVTRHATTTKLDYPLPYQANLEWLSNQNDWVFELTLPDIPAEHIVVPTLSVIDANEFTYVFSISAPGLKDVSLQHVPAFDQTHAAHNGNNHDVSTHIDCWHTHTSLKAPTIRLCLSTDKAPESALVTVSCRPIKGDAERKPNRGVIIPQPKAISQMTAASDIRSRICSPTAVAMCLRALSPDPPTWLSVIESCFDPVSRAYGSWPLAVLAANKSNLHAAVEVFEDWDSATQVLGAGTPMVCSIDFAKGELSGAPLNQTGGHLVVLYGLDLTHAWVLDPAAPSMDSVPIKYPLNEFSRAWLRQRGAAYIFSRPCDFDT